MIRSGTKKYVLVIALSITVFASGAVWSYAKRSTTDSVTDAKSTPNGRASDNIPSWVDSSYSPARVDIGKEITLAEFLKDKTVRAPRVPKYLPSNVKFDIATKDPNGTGIGIHYKMGDDWIDIVEVPKPTQPDYQTQTNQLLKMAERVRPDGTTETVPLRTNGVFYKTLPDGTREPMAVDSPSTIEIAGTLAYYSENLDKGLDTPVTENGRTPRTTTTKGRDFRLLIWWKDGTEYSIAGPNIPLAEMKKIAESMLQ